MSLTLPYYLASRPVQANTSLVVTNKYTGEPAYRVARADSAAMESGIASAAKAFEETRRLPGYVRQRILHHLCRRATERHEELARVVAIEVGKTLREARGEVTRMIDTFRTAAEEAVRVIGEHLPLDISERNAGYEAITRRFPVGPCGFITPFNFPLNLLAHKVAPAIAVGCPFVLKPASNTPVSSLIFGEILAETEWPAGAFSILPCRREDAERLVTDERLKLLSFTGSPDVGWAMKARAGRKRVTLELGGNAACLVDAGSDIEYAADRITFGAFAVAGQSCISVQRILVHESHYEALRNSLVLRANGLKLGDPLDEQTTLGPMISEDDARRIERWVDDAVRGGARLLCGGKRHGVSYEATLLENVDPAMPLNCQEAFGPVATLAPFSDFAEAVHQVNDSRFGLQAGVFTRNLDHAFYAYRELDVGGVIINDVPTMRVDSMPYGGVKESGLGREGVRFAMEEMSEIKVMVLNRAGKL